MNCPNFENYFPCKCVSKDYFRPGPLMDIPKWLSCKDVSTKEIQWTFEKSTPFQFDQLHIEYIEEIDQMDIFIPKDFLMNHGVNNTIWLKSENLLNYRLRIHPNAFNDITKNSVRWFFMEGFDMNGIVDLTFIKGFHQLVEFRITNSFNIDMVVWDKTLDFGLSSNDISLNNYSNTSFHIFLETLTLSYNNMSDEAMSQILQIFLNLSANSINTIDINANKLTNIPKEISLFKKLQRFYSDNQRNSGSSIPILSIDSLTFYNRIDSIMTITLSNNGIEKVEPGAFRGNDQKLYRPFISFYLKLMVLHMNMSNRELQRIADRSTKKQFDSFRFVCFLRNARANGHRRRTNFFRRKYIINLSFKKKI